MRTLGRLIVSVAAFIPVALILSSCAITLQPRRTVFQEHEFAPYAGKGTSTVAGQAFLKTRGGEVKFGAGNEVFMFPVTSYTTEIYRRAIIGGEYLAPEDSRLREYIRTTMADGHGNFEFHNVPAGEYYLQCAIVWEVPSQYGTDTTGGLAISQIKVGVGESVKAILTRQ